MSSVLLLSTEGLTGGYCEKPAFEDISIRINAGEVIGLVGPNGGGKSSLLKCLAGILSPKVGNIFKQQGLRIGYVPQHMVFDRTIPMTVLEFLVLRMPSHRLWFGLASRQERQQIEKQLNDLGAAHLIDRKLGELSGGEFQRVLLASGLLRKPNLILLDEPLTGVDVRGGLTFDALLHHIRDHLKIGVLMVSHDLYLVGHISTRVYGLNRRICSEGSPTEVLNPQNLAKIFGAFGSRFSLDHRDSAFIPLKQIIGC